MPSFLFRLISFFRQMTSSTPKFPKMNVSNKNYIIAQSSMDMNLKLNQLLETILTKLTIYSNQWKNIMVTALMDFTRYVLLFEWTYNTSKTFLNFNLQAISNDARWEQATTGEYDVTSESCKWRCCAIHVYICTLHVPPILKTPDQILITGNAVCNKVY